MCCIKTWDVEEKKVFFNICKSDSIDPPEQVMRDGEEQTRVPMSLGDPYEDVDHRGEPCVVYDVVFNPVTTDEKDEAADFMQFLVQLCMFRIEEKYPERPKLNEKRRFKRLRQKEWKGRQIEEQYVRDEPQVRMTDNDTGLRDFTPPEPAEPTWQVQTTSRRSDGAPVVRLRLVLPGMRKEDLTVRVSKDFVSILAIQLGEIRYKAECPCQRPEGYVPLSTRFHLDNHTLTMVWGPQDAKEFDEMMAKRVVAQQKAAEEAQRIQLCNADMFEIDCSDDD